MSEMEKDFERVKHDRWFAMSVDCQTQNKIWKRSPDDPVGSGFILHKECNANGKPCLIENCVMSHWGLV